MNSSSIRIIICQGKEVAKLIKNKIIPTELGKILKIEEFKVKNLTEFNTYFYLIGRGYNSKDNINTKDTITKISLKTKYPKYFFSFKYN